MLTAVEQPVPVSDDFTDAEEVTFDFQVEYAAELDSPVLPRSDADRARRLMANRERFKESPGQRSAALTHASLEQAAAVDRQTSVLERQAAAMERQNDLTAALLDAQRIANQLTFYAMGPDDFRLQHADELPQIPGEVHRESVFAQMKRLVGIAPVRPIPADADGRVDRLPDRDAALAPLKMGRP